MDYEVVRSRRKTLSLEVSGDRIIVRAPLFTSARRINCFVCDHEDWARRKLEKNKRMKEEALKDPLTENDIRSLADEASKVIPERVRYYASVMGVAYGRITIRKQRTRWGSCSSKGNLSFNCLLMLMPPEVLDSVVVHELCHLKHMDHSDRFYEEVLRVYPEYRKWNKWLKENGKVLMMRLI